MKNLLVIESGGPTSVINSSLYGAYKEGSKHYKTVYGAKYGIEGLIKDELINISEVPDDKLVLLKQTPGAALGSARHKLSKDFSDPEYEAILENVIKHEIDGIVIIGGNDSMDTTDKLSRYFAQNNYKCDIMGCPKTIDNDLVKIDHCPGYPSAMKYIVNEINAIKQDSFSYNRGKVIIVEIMGRDAGWLTASSKLATLDNNYPDLIYLPEIPFDIEEFVSSVEAVYKRKKKVLACVSEGVRDKDGRYIMTYSNSTLRNDEFNHLQLGGVASVLSGIINDRLNVPTRGIELNALQRCSSFIASKVDVDEAYRCGREAVKALVKGINGKMVSFKRVEGDEYKVKYELKDIHEIANKVKEFPKEWIIGCHDVSEDFIGYAVPLMNKEVKPKYKDGVVEFIKLKR
ncbi:MAG: 6-phosphofructokinase [Gammaproteobacteria bacterium]|nr:6-phosphofructokinase [Gammaproteobacteria bacterium]